MDLYEDSFKLQEMIASDMQSSLSECTMPNTTSLHVPGSGPEAGSIGTSGTSDSQGTTATLTDLAPAVPVDPLDDPMDEDEQSWMNGNTSQLFAGMDFETIGQGLLVNPQTGLPVHFPQAPSASPVITSSSAMDESGLGLAEGEVIIKMPSPQGQQGFPYYVIQQAERQEPEGTSSSPIFVKQIKTEPKARKDKQRKTPSSGSSLPLVGDDGKSYPKPAYSYSCLIAMALKNSQSGSLPVNEIYNFMTENFPYFKTAPNGWKNSVRHNLSLNKCFEKIEKPVTKGAPRKGCLWAMNPDKVSKMNEELHKWNSRDPMAIRRSMANPERLEQLSKGELKSEYDEDEYCQQPVVSTTEEDLVSLSPDQTPEIATGQPETREQEETSPHGGGDSLPSLESNIQLDDMDLQYEACMQLLGDSFSNSNSSSQLSALISGQPSENNNNNEQSPAVSFVQCNYIYSTADTESNVTSSLALGAAQEPLITSTANVR